MPAWAISTALRAKPGTTLPGITKPATSSAIARRVWLGAISSAAWTRFR